MFRRYHDLHGTSLYTLTAGGAELFVNHVNTGLGVLGDGTELTGSGTLATLEAGHGFRLTIFIYDSDTGQVLMKLLIESGGASVHARQTSHTLATFFYSKLLHNKESPLHIFRLYYTRTFPE